MHCKLPADPSRAWLVNRFSYIIGPKMGKQPNFNISMTCAPNHFETHRLYAVSSSVVGPTISLLRVYCRYLTAATTFVSGVGYVFAKDTFKLLKQRRQ